jgi:DNA polymerase III epsilon subunit-like protein
MEFSLWGTDTETTGLGADCDPIEISLYRLDTDECRTWCLKPVNVTAIQADALKINGHRREDILHLTAEGRERYRPVADVLVEIENWVMEDGVPAEQRILLGHNVHFDREMLVGAWRKSGSAGTFPFSPKYGIDTMMIEFGLDYAACMFGEGYSLRNLCKKYGVKNEKSHTAEADTRAMVGVFREQMKLLKSIPKI